MSFLEKTGLTFISLFIVCISFSCKDKKKPLTGDELIDISDFIEFFQPLSASFQVADTSLLKKQKDSLLISYKTLIRFIPDSVISRVYGKGMKPKSYPLGRMQDKNKANYLFLKSVSGDTKAVLLACFDAKEKFVAAINLLRPDQSAATRQTAGVDKNFNISKNITRRNADGTVDEGKDVYVLNEETRRFTLIMTEQPGNKQTELINPIDTLPRKQKFSADYSSSKSNLVCIRDAKKPDRFNFFIRFEKDKGECTGELKGEAKFTGKNIAEYREAGDPCVMHFTFSGYSVSVKEAEGCGSHRGLRCSFDGNFTRKKFVKSTAAKR
jgi:hypothetical protein